MQDTTCVSTFRVVKIMAKKVGLNVSISDGNFWVRHESRNMSLFHTCSVGELHAFVDGYTFGSKA